MVGSVKSYRDLDVWQVSIALAESVYATTAVYPKHELYGMASQLRRASVSIAANIAEGFGRETTPAFIQFLRISQGSLKELETHIVISERVKLLEPSIAEELRASCDRIGRVLNMLIRSLGSRGDS